MYYRITVTKDKTHYFTLDDNSVVDSDKLIQVYDDLAEHFTPDKGYEILITLWYSRGEEINIKEIKQYKTIGE